MTFLVADGVTPSNEGRGYVLRRIIRRAVQQARRIGLEDVWRLPAVVVEQMGDAYPELRREAENIEREIKAEEERFAETLARGLERLEELADQPAISADDAFALAATYGFPDRAHRSSWPRSGASRWTSTAIASSWPSTERSPEEPSPSRYVRSREHAREFVGYEKTEVLTAIAALEPDEDGRFRAKLHESPVLRRGRRPGLGRRLTSSTWRQARAPSSSARCEPATTRRCSSRARALPSATACAPSCRGATASRRWQITRRLISCTGPSGKRSATTCSRPDRPSGPTSSASTSRTGRR